MRPSLQGPRQDKDVWLKIWHHPDGREANDHIGGRGVMLIGDPWPSSPETHSIVLCMTGWNMVPAGAVERHRAEDSRTGLVKGNHRPSVGDRRGGEGLKGL